MVVPSPLHWQQVKSSVVTATVEDGILVCDPGGCYWQSWTEHYFDEETCGNPHNFAANGTAIRLVGDGGSGDCKRCGGTSECHSEDDPDMGGCNHIACGGGGSEVALRNQLRDALKRGDMVTTKKVLTRARLIAYLPERRAIQVMSGCKPGYVAEHYTLSAAKAVELKSLIHDNAVAP